MGETLRKQDRVVLWPVYFDSTKTRSEGRRVSKRLASPTPKLSEVGNAADSLGLEPKLYLDASYPFNPNAKTGYITTLKRDSKTKIIREIAQKILEEQKKG